ncbi:ATP-binding protein [Candidatus Micrarchaeota archaeon]|nr:ATP-binding protein [Candidatus Micrarchaeota archaeon]
MFVGREKELGYLKETEKNKFFMLTVSGRRRIGKTTLLKHAFPDSTYLFIPKGRTTQFILDAASETYRIPRFTRFGDLINYLSEKNKPVIIDEAQNFLFNDAGAYSELQNVIDEKKGSGQNLQLILSGSSYSMLNKLFSGQAPLYNRRTHALDVKELQFKHARTLASKLCGIQTLKEQIEAWAVFGGVPYYYEVLAYTKGTLHERLSSLFHPITGTLKDEARLLIASEFGDEYRTYSTIIAAIAEGKTKPNELATLFDNKITTLNKYLHVLVKDYHFVTPQKPLFNDKRSARYHVDDNFLNFWYSFIEKNQSNIEGGNYPLFTKYLKENFNAFVGRRFEELVIKLIRQNTIKLPVKSDGIGRQWGRILGKKGESYEIDFAAKGQNGIVFGECKWQDKVDGRRIERELEQKSANVPLPSGIRGKHYAVFAKSFAKKPENALAMDLNGLEKSLHERD